MSLPLTGAGKSGSGGGAFTPASLPSLAGWWDFSALGLADNAAIASVPDLSGNGRTLAQGTAGLRPLFKTAIQNGLGVARFDGVDDLLNLAFTLVVPATVFFLGRSLVDLGAVNHSLVDGNGGNSMRLYHNNAQARAYAGTTELAVAASVTAFKSITAIFNGASSQIAVNGGTPATGDAGPNSPGGVTVGAGGGAIQPGNCDAGELIVCAASLNGTDRANTEGYFRTKWGTP